MRQDNLVKKGGKFVPDEIAFLGNDYFGGFGGGIRQIFYLKAVKIINVATFPLMAQIGRVAITEYFSSSLESK